MLSSDIAFLYNYTSVCIVIVCNVWPYLSLPLDPVLIAGPLVTHFTNNLILVIHDTILNNPFNH